ncbi:MAG: hypothetical protein Q3X44_02875 [Collinsella sp.]|nr:hypothetical protein [Collinsella sp.]
MELTAMFSSIGLCVGAIVAAAVIYFVVTAIKGKRAERKERAMLKQYRDQQGKRARR